jgi:hypothetical protein
MNVWDRQPDDPCARSSCLLLVVIVGILLLALLVQSLELLHNLGVL